MHFEDHLPAANVGHVHHDLPVEAPRPEQRRIEDVGSVGGGNEDDALVGLEAIHLHEQLVEGLFPLVVTTAEARPTVATHRVDLVDEDDAR